MKAGLEPLYGRNTRGRAIVAEEGSTWEKVLRKQPRKAAEQRSVRGRNIESSARAKNESNKSIAYKDTKNAEPRPR